jgi:hypothetical protein
MTLKERTSRILCIGLVAVAPLLATENAFADTISAPAKSETDAVDDNDRARALYQKASDAFEAGKTEEAHQLLLEAWNIRETYDVALVLGQVELKLKHYRDAAEHLAFCLSHFGPSDKQETLERVRKGFAESKARVAAVKVSTDRDGAEIYVDGLRVGIAPLPSVIFVDPGPRTLTARLNGQAAEQALTAEVGKDYEAQLMFGAQSTMVTVPPVSSGLASTPNPPPDTGERARPNWTPVLVSGGLAVVAAAIGTGFVLDAKSAKKSGQQELSDARAQGGSYPCSPGTPLVSACASIQDNEDHRRSSLKVATVSFVAAGVFTASAVASYIIWARPTSRDSRVAGWISPGSAGVRWEGQF